MQSNDLSATLYDQPSLSASPTSMSGIALCNKDQAEVLAPALTDSDYTTVLKLCSKVNIPLAFVVVSASQQFVPIQGTLQYLQ